MTLRRSGYIDTWRCIAVGLVICAHLVKFWTPEDHDENESAAFHLGQVGVYIFFFISGFVVSKVALSELRDTGGFSAAGFYTRRAFRIVPPLAIYLGTCAALSFLGVIDASGFDLLAAASYVCNLGWADCRWWVAHTWSLAYEEQFYLLFPMLFLWRQTGQRPSPLWFSTCLAFAALPLISPRGSSGFSVLPIVHALFLTGYSFARNEAAWLSIRRPGIAFAIGCVLTFCPPNYVLGEDLRKFYKLVYVLSIPLAVVASGSAVFPLRQLMDLRPLRYLGMISYGLYLWQQLLTGLAGTSDFVQRHLAILLLLMVLACALSYELVEKPLIRLGRRISDRLGARGTRNDEPSLEQVVRSRGHYR